MDCRWRSPLRVVLAACSSLIVHGFLAGAAAAGPTPFARDGITTWLADSTAHGLRAAEPDNDFEVGARAALNRGIDSSLRALREVGPIWLRRITVDLEFREGFEAAYQVAATQPLVRGRARRDELAMRTDLAHDPAGRTSGHLGLQYRRPIRGDNVQFGLSGGVQDYWLADYRRYSLAAELHSSIFRIRGLVFDDVADGRIGATEVPDRRLDGYEVDVAARVPFVPATWLKASRRWRVPVNSEQASVAEQISLRITPIAPVEIETGTSATALDRNWFARLRFKIRLGAGP